MIISYEVFRMILEMQSNYRIMVFSWNTESVSLSETLDVKTIKEHRTSYSNYIPGLTTWRYSSNVPDFYPKLEEFIQEHSPDLVVIGFQEDRCPGSYFHSHLLVEEMPKIGYDLVKRTRLVGVGVTTWKGLCKGDAYGRGIRISVYAKKDLVPLIEKEEVNMRNFIGNDGQDEYVCSSHFTRGKGAVASYIMLPGFGRLAFVCCHLPFDAKSLIQERKYKNRMLRQNALNRSNICFNNIIENLILFKDPIPTHVIYFGDFNYRLADLRSAKEIAQDFKDNGDDEIFLYEMYQEYDELLEQMRRGNVYNFQEGINNQGPIFIPTCKMTKHREDLDTSEVWQTGREDQRAPSWCDRILYNKFNNQDNHELTCTYYNRFDVGNVMSMSDHAAVLGVFELH